MDESEQQAFLRQAKETLGLTWDDLARASGIAPRALKTYRMPETSKDFRALPGLARAAIERLVSDRKPARNSKTGSNGA
ncbi:conserved hypothetical protein [Paraburkholderia tropica]|uniref:hypothetical protein n=1 Tax=Paraburkholderia tropica TaxID=92647 RepID=UPI001CADCC66|nr:hypothetical protein [Paraburkholderia tropica]CAG9236986.1 conserved hypothetical protein [Paraburkholderia tropica]